jgi:hypothetical protein
VIVSPSMGSEIHTQDSRDVDTLGVDSIRWVLLWRSIRHTNWVRCVCFLSDLELTELRSCLAFSRIRSLVEVSTGYGGL